MTSLLLLFTPVALLAATKPSLHHLEQIAIKRATELRMLTSAQKSAYYSSIAAAKLSDPKLQFNVANLPTDTLSLKQEPMTQIQVGVSQALPRGQALRFKADKFSKQAESLVAQQRMMKLEIKRQVRLSWWRWHYAWRRYHIVKAQQSVFRHLLSVSEAQLANNKVHQKDVIRAQLELTENANRLLNIRQDIDSAEAMLVRWLGRNKRTLYARIVNTAWGLPPGIALLEQQINHHPQIQRDNALIAKSIAGVHLANEQFKPGFNIGLMYGERQGQNINGSQRADFISAKLSMDIPFFQRQRQHAELSASESLLTQMQQERMTHIRDLRKLAATELAIWRRQNARMKILQRQIKEADQYAQSTLKAYENTQTDFPNLARAYVGKLNTQLFAEEARFNRDVARINLLYLQSK